MPRKRPACDSKKKTGSSPLSCGGSRNASVDVVGVAKQDAEGNEGSQPILGHQRGLSAGEMEEKIESLVDIIQKNGTSPRGRRHNKSPKFQITSLFVLHSRGSFDPLCAWLRRWPEKQPLPQRRPARRGGPWEFACLILPIPCPSKRRERAA
jgi:hypothetical protein